MTTPRDQLYLDIFNTALEGGINYWSRTDSYHWMLPPPDGDLFGPEDHKGFYADIIETGDGDDWVAHHIDRTVIARGYSLACRPPWRDRIHWSSGDSPPLDIDRDTDWDFDAGDADVIVQLGLGLIDEYDRGDGTTTQCGRYG